MADSERRIPVDRLRGVVEAVLKTCEMSDADAALLTDTLLFADLSGTHSHGVLRVREYVKKLTVDGVDPKGRPALVRQEGACAVVDGGNSMGQIGAHFAMQEAIRRARTHGIAAVAIRGSNHCGAMGYFAMQALEEDMIGIATTNALPTMAPWGGAERILGINPLGVAIPAAEEHPIVFDAAFSGSSHGKIRIYQQKGMALPADWAMDASGRPTTDPAEAVNGLLTPIGGFKGVALALVMGVLSSMLSGAAYGTELGNMEDGPRAGADGHFVAAIKIGAFEDPGRFKARVDKAIREIHDCEKAPGVDRTYAPGELEILRRADYRANGIPLNAVTIEEIDATCRERGVPGID